MSLVKSAESLTNDAAVVMHKPVRECVQEIATQLKSFNRQSEDTLLSFMDRFSDLLTAIKRRIYLWQDQCIKRGKHFQQAFYAMDTLVDMGLQETTFLKEQVDENISSLRKMAEQQGLNNAEFEQFAQMCQTEIQSITSALAKADLRKTSCIVMYRQKMTNLIDNLESYLQSVCQLLEKAEQSVLYAIQEIQFQEIISQSIYSMETLLQAFVQELEEGGAEGSLFCVNLMRLVHGIFEDLESTLMDINVVFVQQNFIVERFFQCIDTKHQELTDGQLQEDVQENLLQQSQHVVQTLSHSDHYYLSYLASKTKILTQIYDWFSKLSEAMAQEQKIKLEAFIAKMNDQIKNEYNIYQDIRQSECDGIADVYILNKNLMYIIKQGKQEIDLVFSSKISSLDADITHFEDFCQWISVLKTRLEDVLADLEHQNDTLQEEKVEDTWPIRKNDFFALCDHLTIMAHKKLATHIAGFRMEKEVFSGGDIILF